jgi:hypothetical protein
MSDLHGRPQISAQGPPGSVIVAGGTPRPIIDRFRHFRHDQAAAFEDEDPVAARGVREEEVLGEDGAERPAIYDDDVEGSGVLLR